MGRRQIRCHGDDSRFDAVADLVAATIGPEVRDVADAAGGRGVLSRLLRKRFNLNSEVIDPRPHVLKGVPHVRREFTVEQASYYDLIIGLHPDGALRPVVEAATMRPTIVVPCCNFWSRERTGLKEMLRQIGDWYRERGVRADLVSIDFDSPYNKAFVTRPPESSR